MLSARVCIFLFNAHFLLPIVKGFGPCIPRANGVLKTSLAPLTTARNSSKNQNDDIGNGEQSPKDEDKDTIRVRIWQALASNNEISFKQLGAIVGERQMSDLKFHLGHVEKQAKTMGNKSSEWKKRRGLTENLKRVKIKKRRGEKGATYIRLD